MIVNLGFLWGMLKNGLFTKKMIFQYLKDHFFKIFELGFLPDFDGMRRLNDFARPGHAFNHYLITACKV